MRKAFGPLPVLTLWIKTLLCMFGRMYQFQCHNQPTRSQLKTRKDHDGSILLDERVDAPDKPISHGEEPGSQR